MAKLKLEIDRLNVESFGTDARGESRGGTVLARSEVILTFPCPPTAVAYTCTNPNTSVGQDCFCTESPTCYGCDTGEDS